MSLKKHIVIVNEYTNAKGGARGGSSPGKYVERYMNRKEASEVLTPFGNETGADNELYINRYMLRKQATEQLKVKRYSNRQLSEEIDDIDGHGGRAFGTNGISLSDKQVRTDSRIIQQAYNEGHSVQKTILSFTEEYLKEQGVVSPDFKHQGRGSYRGQVDQLKLRESIMHGMDKYLSSSGFEAPMYVGVLQMDTNHVHAHLATVDTAFSPERTMPDGTDRGKILERDKEVLRRGIHDKLADMSHIKHYAEQVGVEAGNARSFVQDYTMEKMNQNAKLQSVIAALPEDHSLWRYNTNNRQMKRANELSSSYVNDLFRKFPEESGYAAAWGNVRRYAESRRETEGLSTKRYRQLLKGGRERIMERSVNGLYQSLDHLEKQRLAVNTPPLDKQARTSRDLMADTSEDGFAGFELRVRGYGRKKDKHESRVDELEEEVRGFDAQMQPGTSDEAFGLRRLYMQEMLHSMKCADKYRRHFLIDQMKDGDILPEFQARFEALVERYEGIKQEETALEKAENGELLTELVRKGVAYDYNSYEEDAEAIEVYLGEQYQVSNGMELLSIGGRERRQEDLSARQVAYYEMNDKYRMDAWKAGLLNHKAFEQEEALLNLSLEEYAEVIKQGERELQAPPEPKRRGEHLPNVYSDVKALDIHDVGMEYMKLKDKQISDDNLERFEESVSMRGVYLAEATDFLERTGQAGQSDVVRATQEELTHAEDVLDQLGVRREVPVQEVEQEVEALNTNTIRIHEEMNSIKEVKESLQSLDEREWDRVELE